MRQPLTLQSKIKDVYANPVGHDVLVKLLMQMGKDKRLLTNPLVRNVSLKTVAGLTHKWLGYDFFQTLLQLLNSETNLPLMDLLPKQQAWWKEAVFYQIYARSFMDSNGDGIGDLGGIISKLDYLKDLGVDALWLSPIYDSPCDDNGYDIRNYYEILKEFGTMEEFDLLLFELHKRDMRLIMDLVVNHTSDEHPWFQNALLNPDSPYKDYYFFQKTASKEAPNNWTSFFSGSAWNYYESQKEWALHLFSPKQMDLNWDNPQLRDDIAQMVSWWLKKGVDGFRLDVINYISKAEGLPKGNENIGNLMGFCGIEHYFYGPKLHEYLHELNKKAFAPHKAFSVGETPGIGMEMAKLLTGDYRKELDMIFSFDHLETPGHVRFDEYVYDLNYLKEYYTDWIAHYGNHCQMSLFYDNHDNPRMLSKVNKDPAYRDCLAKLLGVIQFTLPGTPFLFQGQEYGAVNKEFQGIEELKDVESLNLYHELIKTMSPSDAFHKILAGSRDHARTPMQWNSDKNAGFTTGIPWIPTDSDYISFNVSEELAQENSILSFYKKLIAFRKQNVSLLYGKITFLDQKRKNYFGYCLESEDSGILIECNLSTQPLERILDTDGYELCLSNYDNKGVGLQAYEANIYKKCIHDK